MESVKSPWEILGIPENSTDEVAKTAWKKLIIKCHPDKVSEDLREQKAEEFKRVNEAFKTLTEPELRKKYDEEQEARRRFRDSGASYHGATPSRHYNTRTAAPPSTAGYSHRDNGWDYGRSHTEDRYYDDDHLHFDARRGDRQDPYRSKRTPPRATHSDRESTKAARESEKAGRSERRRAREREEKRDRQYKFASVDDDSDERGEWEESYQKRSEEQKARERSGRSDDKKHQRSHSDKFDERSTPKYFSQEDSAREYMDRARQASRPDRPRRSESNLQDAHVRRSSARRPPERISTREREGRREKDRPRKGSIPEIVDYPSERRTPTSPGFKMSSRSPIERSKSDFEHLDVPHSPPPLRRFETMPTQQSSSSRRKDTTPTTASRLRTAESLIPDDSGYSSPPTPDTVREPSPVTPSGRYSSYTYSPVTKTTNIVDDRVEYSNGHRTVLREPEPTRSRPMGPGRYATASARPAGYQTHTVEPQSATASSVPVDDALPRRGSASRRSPVDATSPRDNGRRSAERLFCEVTSDHPDAAHAAGSGGSYFSGVRYGKRYTDDDVQYGSGSYNTRSGRDRARDVEYVMRPSMPSRSQTSVY